jgi:hypothetical protein
MMTESRKDGITESQKSRKFFPLNTGESSFKSGIIKEVAERVNDGMTERGIVEKSEGGKTESLRLQVFLI